MSQPELVSDVISKLNISDISNFSVQVKKKYKNTYQRLDYNINAIKQSGNVFYQVMFRNFARQWVAV